MRPVIGRLKDLAVYSSFAATALLGACNLRDSSDALAVQQKEEQEESDRALCRDEICVGVKAATEKAVYDLKGSPVLVCSCPGVDSKLEPVDKDEVCSDACFEAIPKYNNPPVGLIVEDINGKTVAVCDCPDYSW
jgi:hypothetical protein